jgi:hypothetical protein
VKVTKFSTSTLGQLKGLEQNLRPRGTNSIADSKIAGNAITLHFAKKITMVTYEIRIRCVRCIWKALVKYGLVSQIIIKKKRLFNSVQLAQNAKNQNLVSSNFRG